MKNNSLNNLFKNKYNFVLIINILLLFLVLISFSAAAADYVLQGDEIIFMENEGLVIFEGDPSFKAEDFTVRAERFEVDTKNKILTAFNSVVISSAQDELKGDSLEYNYQSEKGTLYGARGSLGEIYFSGSKLNILSASPVKGVFNDAQFTPCSRKEPHYHFKAKEIRINPDNTLTIHHIVPYIANIPVFYLPYYSVNYDPEGEAGEELSNTFPLPEIGYESGKGVSVEFSYPYLISDNNSGKIYYWKTGTGEERDEIKEFTNNHSLSQNLTFKNRYYYNYDYDFADEVLEEEEKEFSSSLDYQQGSFALEAGLIRDLMPAESYDKLFMDAAYRFQNGLNTAIRKEYGLDEEEFIKTVYRASYRFDSGLNAALRQEYDSQDLIKENYSLNSNQRAVKWNLKYIDGEDYNYYPYLDLSFPTFYNTKAGLGLGKVENAGVELNKIRLHLNYNYSLELPAGFSYHLNHNYRLDHYLSGYSQNYHYSALNTGLKYQRKLNSKFTLNTSLFYEQDKLYGDSPLVDDREEEERFLKPALAVELQGEYPDSAWSIDSDGTYDLDNEQWDEINLKLRKKEDCFDFFIGYEFIEDSIIFGLEL